MQQIFSVIAAASALAVPQTGIATNAPVAVSTCAVADLVNPALTAEFGSPVSYRMLRLTFVNGADAPATQVTFDVMHDGTHTTVTDRGRFSKGVRIERIVDDFTGMFGSDDAVCSVTAITFADGRRWTASGATTAGAAANGNADRPFHPDYSRALTVDQMSRAWREEMDRINAPIVTGGG